jgi:uncharacterized LabA/DUF88 family protein
MDRFAVFVDAAYLLAAGSAAVGIPRGVPRNEIDLDAPSLIRMLTDRAAAASRQQCLRTYWYDSGEEHNRPSDFQARIGRIDDVKLRLGRKTHDGRQKGVDGLVLRDLMTLGRQHSISHAFLLSGDGDLVEGVRVAQDAGVHVTLLSILVEGRQNVAYDLRLEVDREIRLDKHDLSVYIKRARRVPRSTPSDPAPAAVAVVERPLQAVANDPAPRTAQVEFPAPTNHHGAEPDWRAVATPPSSPFVPDGQPEDNSPARIAPTEPPPSAHQHAGAVLHSGDTPPSWPDEAVTPPQVAAQPETSQLTYVGPGQAPVSEPGRWTRIDQRDAYPPPSVDNDTPAEATPGSSADSTFAPPDRADLSLNPPAEPPYEQAGQSSPDRSHSSARLPWSHESSGGEGYEPTDEPAVDLYPQPPPAPVSPPPSDDKRRPPRNWLDILLGRHP